MFQRPTRARQVNEMKRITSIIKPNINLCGTRMSAAPQLCQIGGMGGMVTAIASIRDEKAEKKKQKYGAKKARRKNIASP